MFQRTQKKKKTTLPGSAKPQDFGAAPGYQTSNLPKEQSINSVEAAKTVIAEEPEKENPCFLINQQMSNMNLQ